MDDKKFPRRKKDIYKSLSEQSRTEDLNSCLKDVSTFKEPLQVRSYSKSVTPQHKSGFFEGLYGSPSRSPARSIPSPMRGFQSPIYYAGSPSVEFLRSPYGHNDFTDPSRSPAPYRTPTFADIGERFQYYKLPPMVSPLHATPRRPSEFITKSEFSNGEDSILSELEAIPQPKYSGSFYSNLKKTVSVSHHADSDDDLSISNEDDTSDEEDKGKKRGEKDKLFTNVIGQSPTISIEKNKERRILETAPCSTKNTQMLGKDIQQRAPVKKRTPISTLREPIQTVAKNFLSTLSNLCFFQTGVKISFQQPPDEESVSDLSPENVLGKICAIEDSFCHSDTIPEESVEDALVFYVTKGRMVVEHAPTDHLIDVTEEENLDFKVQFSSYSDGIEVSEFKERLQLPKLKKIVKKGRPSKVDILVREAIQSRRMQGFFEDNPSRMAENSPLANFQEIKNFVEMLVALRAQNCWQGLDLTLPQIGINSMNTLTLSNCPINDDRPNRHEQAPIQIEKPPDSLLMPPPLPSPGPTSISIKEEIVSLPSQFSNNGSVQMIDVLPGPKSVVEIPKHLEKLVSSKGTFFVQIKFRSSMLGPIILSSKTEILALKELVILLIKMFKHREKGNKKIELSTLHCKLTLFISKIRDILQPSVIDYLREACTKKGLAAHCLVRKRTYPSRNSVLLIDNEGNIVSKRNEMIQIKIEPPDENDPSIMDDVSTLSNSRTLEEDSHATKESLTHPDDFYDGPILVPREDKSEKLRELAAALLPSEKTGLSSIPSALLPKRKITSHSGIKSKRPKVSNSVSPSNVF